MNRDVQLIIRAKDEGSKAVQSLAAALESVLNSASDVDRAFGGAGSKVEQFANILLQVDRAAAKVAAGNAAIGTSISNQAKAVHAAAAELKTQQARVNELSRAFGLLKKEADAAFVGPRRNGLDAMLKDVEKQLRQAERIAAGLQKKVDAGVAGISQSREAKRAAGKNAEAIEALQSAAAMREMDAAAAALRAELNPLAAIEARLAAEQEKLNRLFRAGKISQTELAGGMKLLKNEAERAKVALGNSDIDSRGRPSLFGLKPYEVQNLTFQVNDFFTQLASGTSVSQAFAQQIGQVIQLFPKLGNAIITGLRSGPILGMTAAVAGLVLALGRAERQAQALRVFEGLLLANADGARFQAEALVETARELDRYGLSAQQALDITRVFLKEGIRPDLIEEFGKAARDLSVVMGGDVKKAAEDVAKAFSRGFDSISKFDDELNFLTAAERAHIRTLFESGRAEEARTKALEIFRDRYDDAADQMRGPWKDALDSLSNSWEAFMRFLSNNSVITTIAGGINLLAQGVEGLFNALGGAPSQTETRGSALPDTASLDEKIKEREQAIKDLQALIGLDLTPQTLASVMQEIVVQNQLLEGLRQERENVLQLQVKQDAALQRETDALREQNKQLDEKARLQRAYNEALLDAQERFPKASASEHVAHAEQARLRVEKQITEEKKRQREEQERLARDSVHQSMLLLAGANLDGRNSFEGFQKKAKWDVNAFRVGFGSDTTTGMDGRVQRVTANTTTTMEDALRDLERRIREFQDAIKTQIGSDRFGQFSAQQQAALTSIAYNYGSLPERIVQAVKTGTPELIADAVRGLAGDNGGINRTRRNREADILGMPNVAIEAGAQKAADDLLKKQTEYLDKIRDANAERTLEIGFLERLKGKTAEALEAEERAVFIAKEVAKAKEKAADVQIAEDDPRLKAELDTVAELAGAYYDLANAKKTAEAARDRVMDPVNDLTGLRDSIQQQITFLRENGLGSAADAMLPQLDEVNGRLREAIDNALSWAHSLDPVNNALGLTKTQIETIIASLETAKLTSEQWGTVMGISARNIAEAFSGSTMQGINAFFQAMSEGKGVIESVGDAFRTFAASFLRQMAEMILKQQAFAAAMALLKALGVAVPTSHTGGIVGVQRTATRNVSPLWFAQAVRYHSGGIAGLKPNEVPTILERGEEVLTRGDPRHRANRGRAGKNDPKTNKYVLALSPRELAEALAGSEGEDVTLLHIRRNASLVKQIVAPAT